MGRLWTNFSDLPNKEKIWLSKSHQSLQRLQLHAIVADPQWIKPLARPWILIHGQ